MQTMRACAVLVLWMTGVATAAGQAGPCQEPEAHAFDFWLGNWAIQQRILQQDGSWLELPATTSVSRALDGCALVERWEGRVLFFWEGMHEAAPMQGLSVRAWDPAAGVWRIHWMDTRSRAFGAPYVGGFADRRGVFYREWDTPQGHRKGRITFSDVSSDSVTWALAVSRDDGRTWTTLWTMAMRREA